VGERGKGKGAGPHGLNRAERASWATGRQRGRRLAVGQVGQGEESGRNEAEREE
jgi:hypothetical protein